MTIYLSLDEALADVASRSFYEDCTVTPLIPLHEDEPMAWRVENESGAYMSDEWTWTYEGGISQRDSVSETSRLMASYETFTDAQHIRYHMSESVESLESGEASVTFAYAVVADENVTYDESTGETFDSDGHPADDLAGWILAANHWEV